MTRRPMCLVCLILMLSICLANWLGFPLVEGNPLPDELKIWIEKHPKSTIYGEVERCTENEFSQSVYLKNAYLIYNSKKFSIKNVRVFLKEKEENLPLTGAYLMASGSLERVPEMRNPGEFDSRQYYACEHIYYFLRKAKIKKQTQNYSQYRQYLMDLKAHFCQVIKNCTGEDAGVFSAVVLGEKEDLEEETKLQYQMGGIIHMLAISGLHISILGAGLYGLLVKTGIGIRPSGMVVLIVILQYGIMTGGSVSALRAVCMFLIAIGAKMAGRIYDMLSALSIAAILLLLESPAYLFGCGFLLSFGAVIGIGVVLPAFSKLICLPGKVGKALAGSLAVQLTTLPILLYFYGEVSMAGIFLNLLVLPTVGIVLGSGVAAVLLGSIYLPAGIAASLPGRSLLLLYEKLCELAGRIPLCTWIGGRPKLWQILLYYAVLMTIIFTAEWGKSRSLRIGKRLLLAAMVLLLKQTPEAQLRITCLDIGQGDGIVIETPDGGCYIVDCGSSGKSGICRYQLLPYLKSRGISRINGIFVSHTDEDHISGIKEFLELQEKNLMTVALDKLYLPEWENPPKQWEKLKNLALKNGVKVCMVNQGDLLRNALVRMTFLWPKAGAKAENVNEEAMVFLLEYKDFRALFTGDIGVETEKQLAKEQLLVDVDFLKVGHHGSRYSTSDEFLEKIAPEYAVISCSKTNTYGHPARETVERLRACGAAVGFTMKSGAISVETDGSRIRMEGFLEKKSRSEANF